MDSATAEHRQLVLPIETLMDILEHLSKCTDKASILAASLLASSCRTLRSSSAGKLVQNLSRYYRALHVLSLSAPEELPLNLEYETEVLEQSSWPHVPPVLEGEKLQAPNGPDVQDQAFLRGDQYFSLSSDRTSIYCFTLRLDAASSSEQLMQPRLETGMLSRTLTLPDRVSRLAINEEATLFAVAYTRDLFDERGRLETEGQLIEVRCLKSGNLAADQYDNMRGLAGYELAELQFVGSYMLMRFTEMTEVRRWRSLPGFVGQTFPRLWMEHDDGFEQHTAGATLLWPNFLALQKEHEDSWNTPVGGKLHFLRLDEAHVTRVATFDFPKPSSKWTLSGHVVACGARLLPGESGICVISLTECLWLLQLSDLIKILYSPAAQAGELRTFGAEWIASHMCKVELPEAHNFEWRPTVSGWRCAILIELRRGRGDTPDHVQFIDTSRLVDGLSEQSQSSSLRHVKGGKVQATIYNHPFQAYLPVQMARPWLGYFPGWLHSVELQGGRRMVCYHIGGSTPAEIYRLCLGLWRF